MILTDTGPLVALADRGEPAHERCVAVLAGLTAPMVVTWPVFTEAIYLLHVVGGWKAQQGLWSLLRRGDLEIAELTRAMVDRMEQLMQKYADMPMDLADASLVALAEAHGHRRVFTLDSDFLVYRPQHGHFEVVP